MVVTNISVYYEGNIVYSADVFCLFFVKSKELSFNYKLYSYKMDMLLLEVI
ncbi:hypothetical protein [Clostridium sp. DL1XJH146]